MAINDITGDRITSKISKNTKTFEDNFDLIFKKKKETNGGWKYEEQNDVGSVTTINDNEDKLGH